MNEYKLKEHEVAFPLQPIGIQYQCEFCNEGFMVINQSRAAQNPIVPNGRPMMWHKCSACHKEMLLPDVYPKIEYAAIQVNNEPLTEGDFELDK